MNHQHPEEPVTQEVFDDPVVQLAALCPLCALAALSPAAALAALSPMLAVFNPALNPAAAALTLATPHGAIAAQVTNRLYAAILLRLLLGSGRRR
ncbi:MAG: hypothetical protein ACM3XM_01125 [Mycobacterium leprae]